MASTRHAKIIQQVLDEKNISNIARETAEGQLEIYRAVFLKLKELAERHIPRKIPHETLKNSEEALNEITIAFCSLGMKSVGKRFKLEEEVQPRVEQALSAVGRAMAIREVEEAKGKKVDLPQEYHDCIIQYRRYVILVYQSIREEAE